MAGILEKRQMLNLSKHQGWVIGNQRLSLDVSCQNISVAAVTGAKKTSGFVLTNLLTLPENSSAIVTDIKGECFQKTSQYLHDRGFEVLCLDFMQPTRSTVYFNPLLRFKDSPGELKSLIDKIVDFKTNGNKAAGSAENTNYFYDEAKALLGLLARVLVKCPDEFITFRNLSFMVTQIGKKPLDDFVYNNSTEYYKQRYISIVRLPDKQLAGVTGSAISCLGILSENETVVHLFSKDTFDIGRIRSRPSVLFLKASELGIKKFKLPFKLLFEFLFEFLLETPVTETTLPTFIVFEEFGQQQISSDTMDVFLTSSRSRLIANALIMQDVSQLETNFSKSRATTMIRGGVGSRLILPGQSIESCNELQNLLGVKTVKTENGQEISRPFISAEEIRTLTNEMLLISNASRVTKVKIYPYFKDKKMMKYVRRGALEIHETDLIDPPLLDFEQSGDDVVSKIVPIIEKREAII